jgi:outer membrane protein, multidrug efflux system
MWATGTLALSLLAGCAQTPVAPRPALALPTAFRAAQPGMLEALNAAPAGAWWRLFDDAVLDDLMLRAERGNLETAAAAARLAAARAALGQAQAQGRPQFAANAAIDRQDGPLVNAAGTQGSLFTLGALVSYELDIAGRVAAAQDAASLDAQARASLLRSTQLAVQAQVGHTYLALRATDAERALARQRLQAWHHTLQISEERLRQGSVAELAVWRLRTQWHTAQAESQALERRRAELEHALALLLGEAASGFNLPEQPAWQAPMPQVPAGIPSDVLLRRPDVLAAAQQLQAAQARTLAAERAWWPSVALTAAGGQAAPGLADLLRASMRAFSLGAFLTAPLWDGGRREAGVAQARADEDAAFAHSRERVLTAFKEVEDQLVALRVLTVQAEHHRQGADAATRAADISAARWRNGLASHLEVLDAQRTAWQSRAALLQVQAAHAQATVGLVRALGGGWGAVAPASQATAS